MYHHARKTELSPSEVIVLRSFAQGLRASEIAKQMNVSYKTITSFKNRIMVKLDLFTEADFWAYALERFGLKNAASTYCGSRWLHQPAKVRR